MVGGLVDGRAHGEPAGEIGQDIHPPELLHHGRTHPGDRFRVHEVGGDPDGARVRGQCLTDLLQCLRVPVHQGDAGTLAGESLGHGPPHVAGGSGDDDDLIREF